MSYYILKNLKLDEKNNKMSAEVADSCWRDDSGKFIFDKTEDIYPSIKTWEEKYAHLIWSIISGGVRIEGNNKLKRLEGLDGQAGLGKYYEECHKLNDVELYDKYKDVIEGILKEEKNSIIKFKDSMAYLKSIGTKHYRYTFNIEEAKKYTSIEAKNIQGIKEFEVVDYKEELNKIKDERYKLFAKSIAINQEAIEENDLKKFIFESGKEGRFYSYLQLEHNYPNNKLITEIVRIIYSIKNEAFIFDYNFKNKTNKDKNSETKFNITSEMKEQYKESKEYLENMKKEYTYDYDYNKQFEILDKEFKDKYISKELYQESYEETDEEEIEE